jgi:hypothetical protein
VFNENKNNENENQILDEVIKLIKREDFKTNINTLIDKLLQNTQFIQYFNKKFFKVLKKYKGKPEKKEDKIHPDNEQYGRNTNPIGGVMDIPNGGSGEDVIIWGLAIGAVVFGIAAAFAISQSISVEQAFSFGGSKHKKRKGRKSKKTKKSMKHKKSMKKKKGRKSKKKRKSIKKRRK